MSAGGTDTSVQSSIAQELQAATGGFYGGSNYFAGVPSRGLGDNEKIGIAAFALLALVIWWKK